MSPSSADEAIDVGLLIVGAGPAGLACAVRFGQLLQTDPGLKARLGDVPIAVLEKGRRPGAQLMSGAAVDTRSLRALFPHLPIDEIPSYGSVHHHATYLLSHRRAWRIPTPRPMQNRGSNLYSLSQLGRWLAERAEELGVVVLSETAATKLLVDGGSTVLGVRTGDKGVGSSGERLATFDPGVDVRSGVTVLADGSQGHLSSLVIKEFGLASGPQTWELGVKEVWRVKKPLRDVVHTLGWPLRPQAKFREFGGGFAYPMGKDLVSVGLVVGLDYRDAEVSVHDLFQQMKQHPLIAGILEGGERLEWGAKTLPSGGFNAFPKHFGVPGLLLTGDGAGMVNVPTLKGVHYAIQSGILAAEAAYESLRTSDSPESVLHRYENAVRESFIWEDLRVVRHVRQVFARGFFLGGALASIMMATRGRVTLGKAKLEPDDAQPLRLGPVAAHLGAGPSNVGFDKLTSVYAAGNATHENQPGHLYVARRVPTTLATMWVRMCPAQVYELGEAHSDGTTTVDASPGNCVQCGAISAKGGRLTPPEGGSGPNYSLM